MFIPAMTSGLEVLKPLLKKEDVKKFARVVIGTAFGDIHDIGKNLVTIMLEGGGFEVFDLGTSIAPDKFVNTAAEKKANLICISALMTTTMPSMKDTIEALKKQSLKEKIGVIIGGACVTQDYADEIGADGYAEDAVSAVAKAKEIIENQRM